MRWFRSLVVCLSLAPSLAAAQSVLVIPDTTGGSTPSIESALIAAGMTVTRAQVTENNWNGNNPSLAGFDAVVHLNGTTSNSAMPAAGQSALLAWVEAGGGYVTHEFTSAESDVFNTTTTLRPLLAHTCTYTTSTVSQVADPVPSLPSHPLWAGVSAFSFIAPRPTCTVRAATSSVVGVDRSSGTAFATTGLHGVGRTVAFSHAGNYSGFGYTATRTMLVNAVRWAARRATGTVRAIDQHLSTDEDVTILIDLTATTSDGGTPTFALGTAPTSGTITGIPPAIRYRPNANFTGKDAFTFRATNGSSVDYAFITVDVRPVQDPPAAPATFATSTNEDTARSFTVPVTDPDGDAITSTVTVAPTKGTLSGAGITYTYTPTPNANGTDTFVLRFADTAGNSADTTVTMTIQAVNDSPASADSAHQTDEETAIDVTLPATDVDGDTLTCVITQSPASGTTSMTGPCSARFLPATNFNGFATIRWYARDPSGATSLISTATIEVRPVNDPPAPVARSITIIRDEATTIGLTAIDPENDALTYAIATPPVNGTLSGTPPSVTYRPNSGYTGPDSFTFRVTDTSGASATAVVSITVRPPNVAPTAHNDAYVLDEDTALTLTARATDPEGSTLAWTLVTVTNGTLTGSLPTVTFRPTANYSGPATIQFTVNDGEAISNTGTISLTVNAVNDPPTALARAYSGTEDVALTVTFGGTDVEGTALTYEIVTAPSFGTLSGTGATRTYLGNANYAGNDSFTYRAVDAGGLPSSAVAVTVSLAAVNDAPTVTTPLALAVDEDAVATLELLAADPESSTLGRELVGAPTQGSAVIVGTAVRYTPLVNRNGSDVIRWRAFDPQGLRSTEGIVNVTIRPVADRPVATNRIATTDEDTPVNVLLQGTDADGDALTYVVEDEPAHGTVTIAGSVARYVPGADRSSAVTFTYVARDPGGLSSIAATVAITIRPVNDPPVASPSAAATAEDTPVTFEVAATDIDNTLLSYAAASQPAHGRVEAMGGNTFRYVPEDDYAGTDSFTFTAFDGTASSAPGTVNFTVTAVNDAPVALGLTVPVIQDTPREVTLTGSDVDDPASALTFRVVQQPAHGTLTGTPPTLRYAPAALFDGVDEFRFVATDPQGLDSSAATIRLEIQDGNDPPVARPASFVVDEDTAGSFALPASDDDGDPLTVLIVTPPLHGDVNGGALPVSYRPHPNYAGTDRFTYRVTDGLYNSSDAAVDITVRPVNDPPVATGPYSVTLDEDVATEIRPIIRDVDSPSVSVRILRAPSNGTTRIVPGGFVYTPRADFSGQDSLQYAAFDGAALSSTVTLAISVNPVNDVPAATPRALATAEDLAVDVVLGGSDADGDMLRFEVDATPAHGRLEGVPPLVRYVPDADFNGTDRFTFRALDSTAASPPAEVVVTVTPLNDAPQANQAGMELDEDSTSTVELVGTDVDGDVLTFQIEQAPTRGTLSPAGGARFNYAPFPDYSGPDSFTFRVRDALTISSPSRVDIVVRAVNDAPRLVAPTPAGRLSAREGTALAFRVVATDVDDAVLARAVEPMPAAARLDATTGLFEWTPAWTDGGERTFSLLARDAAGAEARREITVDVRVIDVDGDAMPDTWESSAGLDPTSADSDEDGLPDALEVGSPSSPVDTDRDGAIDASDDDSDGDGLTDAEESGDTDLSTPPADSDGDGTPDFRDTDSDGDGLDDGDDNCPTEENASQSDADDDGTGDACDADRDGDGYSDDEEVRIGTDPASRDTDGDTIGDRDEIGDADTGGTNSDGTGRIDARDDDSDGDGISDADEAGDADIDTPPVDTDRDGTPDFRSRDSDGDGVDDATDLCRTVPDPGQEDVNGNGAGDWCEGDRDGDGVNDASDNCPDLASDDRRDTDGDGLGHPCDEDDDGDGVPDLADLCADTADPDQRDSDADGAGDACDDTFDGVVAGGCSSGAAPLLTLLSLLLVRRRRGNRLFLA